MASAVIECVMCFLQKKTPAGITVPTGGDLSQSKTPARGGRSKKKNITLTEKGNENCFVKLWLELRPAASEYVEF